MTADYSFESDMMVEKEVILGTGISELLSIEE